MFYAGAASTLRCSSVRLQKKYENAPNGAFQGGADRWERAGSMLGLENSKTLIKNGAGDLLNLPQGIWLGSRNGRLTSRFHTTYSAPSDLSSDH